MTVRVTTLKGPEAGAYYVEDLPSYYLDGDEPPGQWLGSAADSLGLSGEVVDSDFLAVMAGLHPATGGHLGRRYGETSVRGFDITASAPKSVSLLFALGDDFVRGAALDAHDASLCALAGWIEAHAHTRYRLDGQVVIVDAEGIMAAAFRQHVSRSLEPHLHSHLVIPNRVIGTDGRYLALDARTIKCDQRTLSALYHAGLRAELTKRLGVRWHQPVNGSAEIKGMPAKLLAGFSSRSKDVAERTAEKLERFIESLGRQPTPRERWRLQREAVIDSRPAKSHGHDAESLQIDWAERTVDLGFDPDTVVSDVLNRANPERQLDLFGEELLVVNALDALVQRQSAWRPAELVRELAAAVPTDTAMDAEQLMTWVEGLAQTVIARDLVDLSAPIPADALLRRDGRPVTEAVTARALTTPDVLAQEEAILTWAERRHVGLNAELMGDQRVGGHRPTGWFEQAGGLAAGPELDLAQWELAAAVAGHDPLVLAVGPAGTGKTTSLAPAVVHLRAQGRVVFGVAPSAAAAEVLAETGMVTDTLDKLLVEHRRPDQTEEPFDLPFGSTVIVDEAAMVGTAKLAELAALTDRKGWRVVLVGDPMQFSAVGRGGMFSHLVDSCGAIELDQVRRFGERWEAEASLALRRGDIGVIDTYGAHGRLAGGTQREMTSAVVRAWWQSHQRNESVAMLAPTNEMVRDLNRAAQQLRADAGEIDRNGQYLVSGDQTFYVGDQVATRRNHRQLRTDRGVMVRNRDRWVVTAVRDDGGLSLGGRSGHVNLPADYVADHVELAYAQTCHGAQGRTVDRSLLLLDGVTDARGIYVPMTRGRLSNHAFVVTTDNQTPADVMAESLARDWIDRPAVVRRAELFKGRAQSTSQQRTPVTISPNHRAKITPSNQDMAPLEPAELSRLLEEIHTRSRASERQGWDLDRRRRERDSAIARRDYLQRSINDDIQRRDNALNRAKGLERPLRRHHHRHDMANWNQIARAAQLSIDKGQAELMALDARIPILTAELTQANLAQRLGFDHDRELVRMREVVKADLVARARRVAIDQPEDLVEVLGPRPSDGIEAQVWDHAAARLDQHQSAFGLIAAAGELQRRPEWADSAADVSYRAVKQACQCLDQALDREPEMNVPGLSL